MNYKVVHSENSPRLILFFAGWGMDETPFRDFVRPGYDLAVVWDYRSLHIDWSFTANYSEICILAWSMGVAAASLSTHAIDGRVTRRVAVNGTLCPVSDSEGIPEAVFHGTRDRLDERNLLKFYRRMFADRGQRDAFLACPPHRDIPGLVDELDAVEQAISFNAGHSGRYDVAYIGTQDAIFPAAAQLRAWDREGVPAVRMVCGHWADFCEIMDREFVDKTRMADRFAAGRATYEDAGMVQTEALDRLEAAVTARYGRELASLQAEILEIGCGTGALSRRLVRMAPRASLTLWDIAGEDPAVPGARWRRCDAELALLALPDASMAYIFSASTIQWFNSPERFFRRAAAALVPGGVLAVTTFVRGNLHEISDITGSGLQLPSCESWLAMAEPFFRTVYAKAWERDLDFETPMDALRHLKATGVNSLRGDARSVLRRLPMRLDARYHLTYRPMIMILEKK